MGRLKYVSGVGGATVELDGDATFFGTALPIRGAKPSYDLGYRDVRNYSNPARREAVEAAFLDMGEADRAFSVFSADMRSRTPGTLVADGWEQRAYIEPLDPTELYPAPMLKASMGCVLLDGVWRKAKTVHLFPSSGELSGTKRYVYKRPYRYASEYGIRSVSVATPYPVTFKMVIFGSVLNPKVKIGDNVYRVNVAVPPGGHLVLDGLVGGAKLVTSDGVVSDVYDKCVRGTGEGSGEYAFERIPSGSPQVVWDDTFGFDLTIYEETETLPFGGAR